MFTRRRLRDLTLWFSLILISPWDAALAESVDLDIVPGTYPTPSSVQVELSALLAGSATDHSAISGEAALELNPTTEPFNYVAIDTLELVIDDGMDLSLAGGLLRATAQPGETRVTMIEPGLPTEVINGTFNQTDNLFGFEGTIELVPEGSLDLSTIAPIVTDLQNIRIFREQENLVAEVDFDLIFTGVIQGFEIDIAINGSTRAVAENRVPGDVNRDGIVDASDIDALALAIEAGSDQAVFDLDRSGTVDMDDHDALIVDILNTYYGDANLDLQFNSDDLISVFQDDQYRDGIEKNSTWQTGDWNGDREFTADDIILAFRQDGYGRGPRPIPVPEPGPLSYLATALLSMALVLNRGRRDGS